MYVTNAIYILITSLILRNFCGRSIWNLVTVDIVLLYSNSIYLCPRMYEQNLYPIRITLCFLFDISLHPCARMCVRILCVGPVDSIGANSHLSTIPVTMSVRQSNLVRSTSVWSLRPNEIFHRPTSTLLPLRRKEIFRLDIKTHSSRSDKTSPDIAGEYIYSCN